MDKYNHKEIELKWQKKWEGWQINRCEDKSKKDKRYILDMFPYPSGEGLHVGHPEGYTATDIYCRYLRFNGFNVLHPMGWDAFGLPAENYAIKTGTHPRATTEKNIINFKRQIMSLGFSYDWSREVNTTDPEYFKWTQWIFLQLFNKGLAYEAVVPINWCSSCKTGLANEEVVQGKCDRCHTEVVKKDMKQWMLKITEYADRLLDGLDELDWPESIKSLQRNWIGRSEGAEVDFIVPQFSEILLASGNKAKKSRVEKLLKVAGINCKVHSPQDLKLDIIDVPEGGLLLENANNKAMAYKGKVDMPILALDTGLFIDGEEFDPVRVKRNALGDVKESDLTQDEIGHKMHNYYKEIATKKGGEVDGFWRDAWAMILPNGEIKTTESKRPIVLTNKRKGDIDIYFPLRSLYKSKDTGKYIADQTEEDEKIELQSVINVLRELLTYTLTVFTTRPDTLFGATYMVVAPEHELVEKFKDQISNIKEVEEYIQKAKNKSDLERTDLAKEKTGVELKGIKAINPVNNKEIPVWVADYVLISYGTGAIMAVPAHDERDYEFAQKYNIEIVNVVEPITGQPQDDEEFRRSMVALVRDPKNGKVLSINWGDSMGGHLFIGGGLKEGENSIDCAQREIEEETGYINVKFIAKSEKIHHHYIAHSKRGVKRYIQAVGLYFELVDDKRNNQKLEKDEQDKFRVEWISAENASKKVVDPLHKYVFDKFVQNIPFCGDGIVVNSGEYDGLTTAEFKIKIAKWLEKNRLGKAAINYKLRDWVFSRQRYWGEPIPLIHCDKCRDNVLKEAKYINFYEQSTWSRLVAGDKTVETRALNPEERGRYFGDIKINDCIKAINKLTNEERFFIIKNVWRFKNLRELFNDKEILSKVCASKSLPRDLSELEKGYVYTSDYLDRINKNGLIAWEVGAITPGIIPLQEKDLPLTLPEIEKFEPTGTGESPLAGIKEWVNTTCPKCRGAAKREVNTMPQWAGSSWYWLRFVDPDNKKIFSDKKKLKYWLPVDVYVGGAEHAVLHLLYARFWNMVLFDLGYVPIEEPFQKLINQGLILGPDGEKMSKSRGNVVNPDDVINEYGADTLRMYEMFMGPLEDVKPWDTKSILGVRRFLDKVSRVKPADKKLAGSDESLLHKTIKKVGNDISSFRFNTAISAMMILINEVKSFDRDSMGKFLIILSPFAPHLCEEIWERLGHKDSIFKESWPEYDKKLIKEEEFELVFQVNGRVRDKLNVKVGITQAEVEELVKNSERVQKWLEGRKPMKVIYVPNKLINIVI